MYPSWHKKCLQTTMLNKLLNVHLLHSFSRRAPPKPPTLTEPPQTEEALSSALKIIHAGGRVERYYMAIPAKRILEKYPSFILAKTDVFRRPCDSMVPPDRILKPGEKFYVVPRRTLKNLLRKTKKPNKDVSMTSFVSQTSNDMSFVREVSASFTSAYKKETGVRKHGNYTSNVSGSFSSALKKKSSTRKHGNDTSIVSGSFGSPFKKKSSTRKNGNDSSRVSDVGGSFSSPFKKKSSIRKQGNDTSIVRDASVSFSSSFKKKSSTRKHVRFVGIDTKPTKVEDNSTQIVINNNDTKTSQAQARKRRPRHSVTWQPTLNPISEKNNE